MRGADDELRRSAIGLDVDDSGWETIDVPGHWRLHPRFATSDGPLLHRRAFTMGRPADGQRRWVTIDGVFYQADVWLDGAYLGDPEGYFFPQTFDVTALSRLTDEHVLAVEVACAPQPSHRGRRTITGIFQHWDGIDHAWNPGGLWRRVLVYDTGAVRIDRLRVLCRDADETRAHLRLHARLDSDIARTVLLRTLADGATVGEAEHPLAAGSNEINWSVDLDQPQLWWPRLLGPQPLTMIEVEVVVDGEVADRRRRRTGLREIAWNDWVCSINGERLHLKGANVLPTRAALATATPHDARRDVELAVEAGLDVLRVHAHIADRPFYDAADELGVLLLQDFPLQWGYARSIRHQAVRQAREAVTTLGHHPSIVQWTAHNEPAAAAVGLHGRGWRTKLRYAAGQQLPTWNRSVLDRWVKRAFESADDTRPTVAHSGVLPHLPQVDGTDSHLYFGWYHGTARGLASLAERLPRLVRFVSEFGAQAVPESADFIDTSRWPDLDWEHLAEHHGLQKWVFDTVVPPADHATFDTWRTATQRYQAQLLKVQIETLRRLKYRPNGGFCFFALNDPAPMVSWSVLDHARVAKLGYHAVTEACRPVVIVADPLPDSVVVGDEIVLDVHVVNDLRRPIIEAEAEAVVTWHGGSSSWRFGGEVGADECVKVGRVRFTVPDTLGELRLDLAFSTRSPGDDVTASNRYTTAVTVL